MDRFVDVAPGIRLWAEERGAPDAPPLLLIMGAQASGVGWPDELVGLLAARHRVIRYDHRDTGRSTRAFDRQPYPITTLVVSAPAEPVYPPPHAQHLAQAIHGARLVEIPGMGHALPPEVRAPLAAAILDHCAGR